MATTGLQLNVGADVTEAVAGLKDVATALTAVPQKAEKVQQSFKKVEKVVKEVAAVMPDLEKRFADAMAKVSQSVDQNVDKAINTFSELEKEIRDTVPALSRLQQGFQNFGGVAKNSASSLQNFNLYLGKSAPGFKEIPKGANQAAFALTNLGRVAQDAPFGFIGIQNNINPLLESFGRLKQETGSTGGALKALASSFLGPAGLGVAVSLVTSAITFFVQAQQKAKREAKEATKDTDSYVKKLSEQKTELTGLVNLAKDASQADEVRARALQKLNDIIPDTIGKLTKQNIATAQGTNIIREYVKALEAQATAELLVGRIAENNVKLFDNRTSTLKEVDRINKEIESTEKRIARQNQAGNFASSAAARQKIIDLENEKIKVQDAGRVSANGILADNENIRRSYEALLPTSINLTKLSTDRAKALKDEADILEDYRNRLAAINFKEQATGADLLREKLDLATTTFEDFLNKGIKPTSGEFQFINSEVLKFINQLPKIKAIAEEIQKLSFDPSINLPDRQPRTAQERFKKAEESVIVITPEALKRQGEYALLLDEISEKYARQVELTNQISGVINNGINQGIDTFFNAIANNQDPFEALAQSAKRLVVELAAAVVKALLLQAVTAAFSGGASAGLGGLAGGLGGGGGGFLDFILRGDLLTGAISGNATRRRRF